jgi:predicted RNase H-like HicB family nuclease
MFIAYIQAALRRAKYELLADHEGFVATIPGFKGLIAHGESLEACRDELQEVLQSWMLLRMDQGLHLPVIDRLDLNCGKHAKRQARISRTARKVA